MTRISAALALVVVVMLGVTETTSVGAKTGGGGCHEPRTDAPGTRVDLKHNCFLPTVLRVDEGATVTFESLDVQVHSVTSAGSQFEGGWGSFDELGEGSIVTETFEQPGIYPYFCVFHPGMVGAIVVGDGTASASAASAAADPVSAFASADADGRSISPSVATIPVVAALALVTAVAAGVGALVLKRARQP